MKRNKKMFSIIPAFMIAFIALIFTSFVYANKEIYLKKYDAAAAEEQYYNSQWAKGWYATTQMNDADYYAWSGWSLIQGQDPALFNKDKPVLGKYFIGLSILLFKNEIVFSFFWGIGVLVISFLLGRMFLKDTLGALVLPLILCFEPLFRDGLTSAMLDLSTTFFTLLFVWFFIKAQSDERCYYLSSIVLGLLGATKVIALLPVFGAVLGFFLLLKRKIKLLITSGIVAVGVYFLVHLQYFFYHGLGNFLYWHFWIFWFARNIVPNYPHFQIWRLLLLGDWLSWKPHPPEVWFDLFIVHVKEYWLPWTIGTLLFFHEGITAFKMKENKKIIVAVVVLAYLFFLSFTPPYARYLLPVLPFIYLLAISAVKRVLTKPNPVLKFFKKRFN